MSLLLNAFAEAGWVVAILIILVIIIVTFVKKAEDKREESGPNISLSDGDLNLHKQYMDYREVIFYEYLQRALPDGCVAFPRVGVDNIVEPKGSKNFYNAIMSKYVDYVVFMKKTMKPILYIDLYEDSLSEQILKEEDKNVEGALKAVKLPKLSIKVNADNFYDVETLKYDIAEIIDPVNLALLKKSK